MKKIIAILLLSIISTYAQEKYTTSEAVNHYQEEAIITGILTQVSTPRSGMIYLNLDGKFPDNIFTGVIFKKNSELFTNLKELEGKKIEILGKVEEYKGKPQIILKEPSQLKIAED
jgi:DNA/RNA endonuclease YhcR with UshA esterase domain